MKAVSDFEVQSGVDVGKINISGMSIPNAIRYVLEDDMRSERFIKNVTDRVDVEALGDPNGLAQVGNPLFKSPEIMNEFIGALIDVVGITFVRSLLAHNPLAAFKTGSKPVGNAVREIHVNPAKKEKFDNDANPFKRQLPDVAVTYHVVNREEQYTVTVTKAQLNRAFYTVGGMEELIQEIVNTLYVGNVQDEYLYTNMLFGDACVNNKIVIERIDNPIGDFQAAKDMTKTIMTLIDNFRIPSTKYNSYKQMNPDEGARTSMCLPENIRIVTTSTIKNELSVELLAFAFNMDKADVSSRFIIIDEFLDGDGEVVDDIYAIVADTSYAQIYDEDTIHTDAFNARALYFNHFLTVFQTFSVSPFANAVALVSKDFEVVIPEPTPEPTPEP